MNAERTQPIQDNTVLQWLGKTYHIATTVFEKTTDVTAARWRLLFLIHRQKSCTQKFLITEIRVDPGSITRQLKTLEAEGLIHRESDPIDNRLTRVALSPQGAAYVEEIYVARQRFLERMVEGIPAEDVQTLTRVLEHIARNLGDDRPLP